MLFFRLKGCFQSLKIESFKIRTDIFCKKSMKLSKVAFLAAGINGETVSCNGSGVQAIPNRCTQFVNCDRGSGTVQSCGPGTVFHKVSFEMDSICRRGPKIGHFFDFRACRKWQIFGPRLYFNFFYSILSLRI